jgi:uncharacterized protein YecE (DUF72 family)
MWRTTSWGYVRLHQGREEFPPDYGNSTLRRWLRHIDETWAASDEVLVYFNNDPGAAAVRNAKSLRSMTNRLVS